MSGAGGGLDKLLDPRSIAIIGASDDPARITGRTLSYLKQAYQGRILPVNRRRTTVQGLPAAPTVSALDEVPELAIIGIQADSVLEVAEECAACGVGALLVFSAGFAETGPRGAEMQQRLSQIGRQAGMRICGPNCIGLANVGSGVLATFTELHGLEIEPGPTALVSQSGAFGAAIFKSAQRAGIRVGYFCTTGNEADVSLTELLAYFVELEGVRNLVAFAEQIPDPELLLATAERARCLDKPLSIMKVGRSEAGARAAISHTGSLVGSDGVIDAVFRQAGISRPEGLGDLLDHARLLATPWRPTGRRIGIVTTSGGVGILLADAATAAGLEVPALEGPEHDHLRELMPHFASAGNPIDCTGQVVNDQSILRAVLETVARAPQFDLMCVAGFPDRPGGPWLSTLSELRAGTHKPILAWCSTTEAVSALDDIGIPAFLDPSSAMRAAAGLTTFALRLDPGNDSEPEPAGFSSASLRELLARATPGPLPDENTTSLLRACGIPVVESETTHDPESAARAGARMGWPVAVKVVSPDLPHKSDAGGVLLGLESATAVREKAAAMLAEVRRRAPAARIAGVLVQRMAPKGLELMIGMHRDPDFGPILAVGLGGTLTEISGQHALRRAPVTLAEAHRAVEEVSEGRLVSNRRGLQGSLVRRVAEVLTAVGRLACHLPEVSELDLNPLVVGDVDVTVVDALVVLGDTGPSTIGTTARQRRSQS